MTIPGSGVIAALTPGGVIAVGFWALVALGVMIGFAFDLRRYFAARREAKRDRFLQQVILGMDADTPAERRRH